MKEKSKKSKQENEIIEILSKSNYALQMAIKQQNMILSEIKNNLTRQNHILNHIDNKINLIDNSLMKDEIIKLYENIKLHENVKEDKKLKEFENDNKKEFKEASIEEQIIPTIVYAIKNSEELNDVLKHILLDK